MVPFPLEWMHRSTTRPQAAPPTTFPIRPSPSQRDKLPTSHRFASWRRNRSMTPVTSTVEKETRSTWVALPKSICTVYLPPSGNTPSTSGPSNRFWTSVAEGGSPPRGSSRTGCAPSASREATTPSSNRWFPINRFLPSTISRAGPGGPDRLLIWSGRLSSWSTLMCSFTTTTSRPFERRPLFCVPRASGVDGTTSRSTTTSGGYESTRPMVLCTTTS
mmetsp:Transcript_15120/g.31134  ORF Transcript_15120/g.31134 Transcript_15120/m.31134 type:complete len:218 (+) Transcript_15120:278-931(+)